MALGAYDVAVASHQAEPEWPTLSMKDLLRIAFRDRLIEDWEHLVLRRLHGEA